MQKTIKTSNKNARKYVMSMLPFKGNNTFGEIIGEGYVVYSYGTHWILYLWDGVQWYGSEEKFSVSTSKHSSQLRPLVSHIEYVTQDYLKKIKNSLR